MPSTMDPRDLRAVGQAVDLAAFEQYLQDHLRPITEHLVETWRAPDAPWAEAVEAAANHLLAVVTLAQLGPGATDSVWGTLRGAIGAEAEASLQGALLELVRRD